MKTLVHDPEVLLRLTGRSDREFGLLLLEFEDRLHATDTRRTVAGQARRKPGRAGLPGGLQDAPTMLVFILFYYRWYPMQAALGTLFGHTQQWASLWIKYLTPVLASAQGSTPVLPTRKPLALAQLIEFEAVTANLIVPRTRAGRRPRRTTYARCFDVLGL